MKYTADQIERARKNYNAMLVFRTLADYKDDIETTGKNAAEQRMDYHNKIVSEILAGNQELIKEWKLFFLNEEVKKDRKLAESKAKLIANKEASADLLAPIKAVRKLGDFGKWLNTSGNPFRKEHFSCRCYTMWRILSTKAQYEAPNFELVKMFNRSTSAAILYSTC